MSDYFARLADRVLGVAEGIEPRVPYRFETAGYAETAPVEPEDEPPAETEISGAPPGRLVKNSPSARVDNRTMPASPAVERSPRDASRTIPPPATASKSPNITDVSRREPAQTASITAPRIAIPSKPKPQAPVSPSLSMQARPNAARGAPVEDRGRTDSRPLSRPMQASMPAETPVRDAPRPTPGPVPMRQAPHPITEAQPYPWPKSERPGSDLRPRSKNQHDLAPLLGVASPERHPEPPREPTIKVTIGRVEVRAVMEPPRPPSKPRGAANRAPPLDDFLRHHEERRR